MRLAACPTGTATFRVLERMSEKNSRAVLPVTRRSPTRSTAMSSTVPPAGDRSASNGAPRTEPIAPPPSRRSALLPQPCGPRPMCARPTAAADTRIQPITRRVRRASYPCLIRLSPRPMSATGMRKRPMPVSQPSPEVMARPKGPAISRYTPRTTMTPRATSAIPPNSCLRPLNAPRNDACGVGSAITGRRLLAAREPDEVDLPDAREPFEAVPMGCHVIGASRYCRSSAGRVACATQWPERPRRHRAGPGTHRSAQ